MDFYLSLGGSKAGPFSIFKVGDLLERGDATPDTLAWHRDLDGWKPIREVASLEAVCERSPAAKPKEPKETKGADPEDRPSPPILPDPPRIPLPPEPFPGAPLPEMGPAAAQAITRADAIEPGRPFIRFWARMFDYTLVSVMVFLLSDYVAPQPQAGEPIADFLTRYLEEMRKPEALTLATTLFFALFAWHIVEAMLIHLFGATPGKALFGIRVKNTDGDRPSVLLSLGRSFYVYVLGAGFYQAPFILIGMIFSLFRLITTGNCLWDQHLKTRVEHAPLGAFRIMLAIGAFFVLILLQSVKLS
ncbi:MAG: hypothetical protein B9S36_02560 [Verrucomicrobiia bacterium Tous-C2TDCM]|nr:MAG: hypothetical protein B9S36_02560 [Verrucomicrobiae bacterium Tous-C2TDCM]